MLFLRPHNRGSNPVPTHATGEFRCGRQALSSLRLSHSRILQTQANGRQDCPPYHFCCSSPQDRTASLPSCVSFPYTSKLSASDLSPPFVRTMKPNSLFFLFCFFAVICGAAEEPKEVSEQVKAILDPAFDKWCQETGQAVRDYDKAIAKTFQYADKIEVFLISTSEKHQDGNPTFPSLGGDLDVAKSGTVEAKDVPKWSAALRKEFTSTKERKDAFCHYAIHGLRVYSGNDLLFEGSFCWACNNMCYSTIGDTEKHMMAFSEDVKDLKALLNEFMPIPAAEKKQSKDATAPAQK